MKFIHLADLHLGKRVNEFSMIEDQTVILAEVLRIVDEEKPRAAVIAGDVYDKSVPSAEAVQLFDGFLCALSERGVETFVISGNHDSAERLSFGGRLMERSGVHIAPVYSGHTPPVILTDEWGELRFYLLPFFKPSQVRRFFGEELQSYTEAVAAAIGEMNVDTSARNVLVTHHFVTGAVQCESESFSVGGADNVDASAFESFDYVALGHIHGPQSISRETVRYSGTPLKYSFSEKDHRKSVTVVEMGEKGSVDIRTVPLTPLHELRELRGSYAELTLRSNYKGTAVDDYLRIVLTDEDDVPDAMARLRVIYPNVMKLEYDNARTRAAGVTETVEDVEKKTDLELFEDFFQLQNGRAMSREQRSYAAELLEAIREDRA